MGRTLLRPALLLVALVVTSCGAGQALGSAFNIETNPYKGEVDPAKMNTSALDGNWRINVADVAIDDPSGVLGFTAASFQDEVNGQTFWFDAGAISRRSLPFSVSVAESKLVRLDAMKYKLEATGTVTVETDTGNRNFWAEIEVAGSVNSSYTRWAGEGELTYRELDTGDITGRIALSFILTKL